MKINAYLSFNGNCKEAFEFYKKCLNGGELRIFPISASPMADKVPPESRNDTMHASLDVGSATIMGSDTCGHPYHAPAGMTVSIAVSDAAEAERIFSALSEGGDVKMPMQQTFWAVRFGMLTDRYGVPWMVNCEQAA